MTEHHQDYNPSPITSQLLTTILSTRKRGLEDPKNRAFVDQHAAIFRDEITQWRLDKIDPDSPLLDSEVIGLMVQGFHDLIENFDTVNTFKPDQEYLENITHAGPAIQRGMSMPQKYFFAADAAFTGFPLSRE